MFKPICKFLKSNTSTILACLLTAILVANPSWASEIFRVSGNSMEPTLKEAVKSNEVKVEDIFKVVGTSMYPTLKDNEDYIKLVSPEYQEGDMVLSQIDNGDFIVKRYINGELVPDNKGATSFTVDEVKNMSIFGKVEKVDKALKIDVKDVAYADFTLKINDAFRYGEMVVGSNSGYASFSSDRLNFSVDIVQLPVGSNLSLDGYNRVTHIQRYVFNPSYSGINVYSSPDTVQYNGKELWGYTIPSGFTICKLVERYTPPTTVGDLIIK